MSVLYGGRLGKIMAKYPTNSLCCSNCESQQLQIINYLSGDPKYRCRKCRYTFTLPFED